jgi:LuxR family maltose regulon positive regulatory protein
LDHGNHYKLVLIVAPAETGKAEIIQQWTKNNINFASIQPTFLTIELEDNEPSQFLRKLIAEIKQWDPNVEDHFDIQHADKQISNNKVSPETKSIQRLHPSIETQLNELINRLMILAGDRFIIMLNYHHIENPNIHAMITYLIDYLPPNLHLVMTSQTTPPLQIPRLRARRELLEIGPGDLQ